MSGFLKDATVRDWYQRGARSNHPSQGAIPMSNEPPQWALDKAAKAAGYTNISYAKGMASQGAIGSMYAHAATLAKYEKEPVDVVLLKAREIAEIFADSWSLQPAGECYRRGENDHQKEMVALIAALRGDQ